MHRLLLLITAVLLAPSALASEPPVYTGLLSNTGAGGYDLVSYFEAGEPTKGSADYSTRQGRLYLNYNQSVQDRWLQSPEEFIQQADANWPRVLD